MKSPSKTSIKDLAELAIAVPVKSEGPTVENFVKLVQQGIDFWNEAGRQLVIALDRDKDFIKKVRTAHPNISLDMITVFERIGRKQIYTPLLADNSIGARKLLEMPYEIQRQYADAEVDVVTDAETGACVKRRISELSRAQAKSVFPSFSTAPASKKEQLATLRERKADMESRREGSSVTPTAKRIERIGCFHLTLDGTKIVMTPCKETWRAQQVKIEAMPEFKGARMAEILLYKML